MRRLATEMELRKAEQLLGIEFPADYIQFVLHEHVMGRRLDYVRRDVFLSMREIVQYCEDRLGIPNGVVPFLDPGNSGDCFCFDYRTGSPPFVVEWSHECAAWDLRYNNRFRFIAPSFHSFRDHGWSADGTVDDSVKGQYEARISQAEIQDPIRPWPPPRLSESEWPEIVKSAARPLTRMPKAVYHLRFRDCLAHSDKQDPIATLGFFDKGGSITEAPLEIPEARAVYGHPIRLLRCGVEAPPMFCCNEAVVVSDCVSDMLIKYPFVAIRESEVYKVVEYPFPAGRHTLESIRLLPDASRLRSRLPRYHELLVPVLQRHLPLTVRQGLRWPTVADEVVSATLKHGGHAFFARYPVVADNGLLVADCVYEELRSHVQSTLVHVAKVLLESR